MARLQTLVDKFGTRGTARILTESGHPTAEATVRFSLHGRAGRSKASQARTRARLQGYAQPLNARTVRDPGESVVSATAPESRSVFEFKRRGNLRALRIGQFDTTDRQGKVTKVVRRQPGRPTVEALIVMASAAFGGGRSEWTIAFFGTWRYPSGQEHLDRMTRGGKAPYPLADPGIHYRAELEDVGPGGAWHRGWYSVRTTAQSVVNAVQEINRDINARITLEPRMLRAEDEAARVRHIKMGDPKQPLEYPSFAQRLANELTGLEWAAVTSIWIGEAAAQARTA